MARRKTNVKVNRRRFQPFRKGLLCKSFSVAHSRVIFNKVLAPENTAKGYQKSSFSRVVKCGF